MSPPPPKHNFLPVLSADASSAPAQKTVPVAGAGEPRRQQRVFAGQAVEAFLPARRPSRGPGGLTGLSEAARGSGCLQEAALSRPGDCSGNPAEPIPDFRLSHCILIRSELFCQSK